MTQKLEPPEEHLASVHIVLLPAVLAAPSRLMVAPLVELEALKAALLLKWATLAAAVAAAGGFLASILCIELTVAAALLRKLTEQTASALVAAVAEDLTLLSEHDTLAARACMAEMVAILQESKQVATHKQMSHITDMMVALVTAV